MADGKITAAPELDRRIDRILFVATMLLTQVINHVTSHRAIHRLFYWTPVLFGLLGAALAALAMIFPKNGELKGK